MLDRSLRDLRELVDRSIQEVRIAAQPRRAELVQVYDLLADLIIPARAEAAERGVRFVVMPVVRDVAVFVDRMAVTAAIANLIQNALKFTRQCSSVTLSVVATPLRVLIEVGDECGGLPRGRSESLFLPFVQRSNDASGLGLGLVIARRAVEAAGGLLSVRDRPGLGCVFTANLPRGEPAQ